MENHVEQPRAEDLRKMKLLLRVQHSIEHSIEHSNPEIDAEIQDLMVAKEQLLQQIDVLGQADPFTPMMGQQIEVASGTLELIEIRLDELRARLREFRVQFGGRIQNSLLSHLLRARLLEFNSVQTARFLEWMRANCGWTGVACFGGAIHLEGALLESLGLVPRRQYFQLFNVLIFGEVVIPQADQENQN